MNRLGLCDFFFSWICAHYPKRLYVEIRWNFIVIHRMLSEASDCLWLQYYPLLTYHEAITTWAIVCCAGILIVEVMFRNDIYAKFADIFDSPEEPRAVFQPDGKIEFVAQNEGKTTGI